MKIILTTTIVLAMLLPAAGSAAQPASLAAARPEPVPGELLVQFRAGVSAEAFLRDANGSRRATELRYGRPLAPRFNIHLLRFAPERADGEALLMRLRTHPLVLAAQFNYEVAFRNTVPDDPDYERQWGLSTIGAPGVWDITTGGLSARGDEIVVAVLDAGFDIDHEDLRDNIWFNTADIPGDGLDNDGNGYVDDVAGWNFVDDAAVHRVDQHGHSVAGIVGARGNNGAGVSGVNWRVKLMLLDIRFVDQIVAAYAYVLDQRDRYNKTQGREGAFVVATNASFGIARTFCADQPVWGAMYDRLGEVGVLTGAGTANNAWDVEEVGDMPTTCTSEYLVTCLNVNDQDVRHQGTAYGAVSIDMGAPGQNSYTTKPGDSYGIFNGNSAAAPHLTGAIALLYSLPCDGIAEGALRQPAQTARDIRDLLLRGVDPLTSLAGTTATGGRLNIFRSMQLAQSLCEGTTGPLRIQRLYPNPVSGLLTVEFETPDFDPYELRVYNALGQEIFREDVTPSRFSVKRLTVPTIRWAPGVYTVALRRGKEVVASRFVVQH